MINKGDFVELDYIGRVKETNDIFDVTRAEDAKKHDLFNERAVYRPAIICIGQNMIVKGVDDFLLGKECKTYTLELQPEQAFGKKDAKYIKMLPLAVFTKKNIKPFPGLQLNFDGMMGTIKTVSGGRVVVDFNHPLSGRTVVYELHVKRVLTDEREKFKALTEMLFGEVPFDLKDHKGTISFDVPEQLQGNMIKRIQQLIPTITSVTFKKPQQAEQKPASKAPAEKVKSLKH